MASWAIGAQLAALAGILLAPLVTLDIILLTLLIKTILIPISRAQIVSQVIIQATKIAVRRDRPTGECCSFPSGHAASAFATASVLERHSVHG